MPSILVVEPSASNRLYLKLLLNKNGFNVYEASSGEEALKLFSEKQPDLIISEETLPRMSGESFVKEIKTLEQSQSGETLTPIFIVTATHDVSKIEAMLAVGADDFLQKPYFEKLFLAKLRSMLRTAQLYYDLSESKKLSAALHKELELEQFAAEKIFDKFVNGPIQKVVGVNAKLSSASIFNGDVFLSAIAPSGNLFTLLGDFTGHGLPAAIGAIPVAESFYSMVQKGLPLQMIVRVINDKLKEILPVHIFFGCIAVQICPNTQKARVLNAGMQPALLINKETRKVVEFESTLIPLGVMTSDTLDMAFKWIELDSNEFFCFFSDGIVEAKNAAGEMFGVERVKEALLENDLDLNYLINTSKAFCAGDDFDDDASLILIDIDRVTQTAAGAELVPISEIQRLKSVGTWTVDFCFDERSLQYSDRIVESVVEAIMMNVPVLRHKQALFIIVSELSNNMIEHGILKLDSEIKQQSNGYEKFLALKKEKLARLSGTKLTIKIEHEPLEMDKEFTFAGRFRFLFAFGEKHFNFPNRCEDFEGQSFILHSEENESEHERFYGRGNVLLSQICSRLGYYQDGQVAEAIFDWQVDGEAL